MKMNMIKVITAALAAIGTIGVVLAKLFKADQAKQTSVLDVDVMDMSVVKSWMNSLDVPNIESSWKFYIVKVLSTEWNKYNLSESDRQRVKNAKDKKLYGLVLSDGEFNTKESSIVISNSASQDFSSTIIEDITEIKIK